LKYHNFDFNVLICSHFCILTENLVRFRLVTLEF